MIPQAVYDTLKLSYGLARRTNRQADGSGIRPAEPRIRRLCGISLDVRACDRKGRFDNEIGILERERPAGLREQRL